MATEPATLDLDGLEKQIQAVWGNLSIIGGWSNKSQLKWTDARLRWALSQLSQLLAIARERDRLKEENERQAGEIKRLSELAWRLQGHKATNTLGASNV